VPVPGAASSRDPIVSCSSSLLRHGIESPIAYLPMMHKYSIGQLAYFEGPFGHNATRGQYKIVSLVPIENNNKLIYRIKNPAEAFTRIAEEHQLRQRSRNRLRLLLVNIGV